MRLTLRTLLAYLDDLLDPPDAVEMGKRIEENKIATELVHRIRTRMRLLRLGAPKVDGRGIGLDANTVAEYLDNTLPADRVLDFEKVCLESDIHLAEVASCHQVLAAVMDKPAQVDSALRLRMYNLISLPGAVADPLLDDPVEAVPSTLSEASVEEEIVPPPVVAPGVARGANPALAGAAASGSKGDAAGSLAAGTKKRVWLLALSVALVFLVVLGGLRALGPFDASHPLLAWRGGVEEMPGDEVAMADGRSSDTLESPGAPTSDALAGTRDGDAREDGAGQGERGDRGAVVGDVEPSTDMPSGSTAERPVSGKELVEGQVDGEGRSATATPGAPGTQPMEPAGPRPGGSFVAPDAKPGRATLPLPFGSPPSRPGVAESDEPAVPPADSPTAPPAETPDAETEVAVELGRFLSEEHILARRGSDDGLWYRLARGSRLLEGDHLVSLPVYRPQLLLSTGVQVMLVGESSIRMNAIDGMELPEVTVEHGRLLMASAGRPGAAVRLNLAGELAQLRFVDVDAEAAVEVRRTMSPGDDPLGQPIPTALLVHARGGRIGVINSAGEETLVSPGEAAVWRAGETLVVDRAEYPSWTSPPAMGGLDRRAAEDLAGFIKLERPITLSLGELAEFRKTEVRSLAARCLGLLGQHDALWGELLSDKQYSYWDEALDGLRDAIARSPEEAAEVRGSIERLRKRNAEDLFRMLRGYSAPQLEQGGAAQLVEWLEHDDLEMRVLAFENLRRITESTHNYRPEKPPEARRIQVQEWRKQLKEGRIVYKTRSMAARGPASRTGVSPSRTSSLRSYGEVR